MSNKANLLDQSSHFSFGKNWLDYAEKIDESKIDQAMEDLRRLSGDGVTGKSFFDIGCGSGLHALSAIRLRASEVAGIDLDPESVAATTKTMQKYFPDVAPNFEVGSVFDLDPATHGKYDVVYSWGVLHHTGDMYRAIRAASSLVADDGVFLVALYKKTPLCGVWRVIKRWYSSAPERKQRFAQNVLITLHKIGLFLTGRNFATYVEDYGRGRGMDYYNDIHDWLGGYPYESISPGRCVAEMERLGLRLERSSLVKSSRLLWGILGSACDEYAFRRVSGRMPNAE